MLFDWCPQSPGSEQRHDPRCSEHHQEMCCVIFAMPMCTRQDRWSCQTAETTGGSVTSHCGRVRIEMPSLQQEQKEWALWLDKAVELVKDRLNVSRSHILRARLGADVEERWNRESSAKLDGSHLECRIALFGNTSAHHLRKTC